MQFLLSWKNIITEKNPKTAFDSFFVKISVAFDASFPLINVKPKSIRFSHSPWMSAGLFISHKKKEKLFAKKLRCPSPNNIENFKTYNKIYNKLRRAAKILHYDQHIKNIKETWCVIKEVIDTHKKI